MADQKPPNSTPPEDFQNLADVDPGGTPLVNAIREGFESSREDTPINNQGPVEFTPPFEARQESEGVPQSDEFTPQISRSFTEESSQQQPQEGLEEIQKALEELNRNFQGLRDNTTRIVTAIEAIENDGVKVFV